MPVMAGALPYLEGGGKGHGDQSELAGANVTDAKPLCQLVKLTATLARALEFMSGLPVRALSPQVGLVVPHSLTC